MDPMLGMVFMVPWNWAPQDYSRCAGQQMAIQQYAALYSLLGTIYGGNGSTTFFLPNLQCRMPMGFGQGTIGTGIGMLNVGQLGGSFISTLSQANIPVHTHTSTFTSGGAGGATTITGTASLPFSTTATLPTSVTGSLTLGVSTATGNNTNFGNGALLAKPGLATGSPYAASSATADTVIGGTQTFSGNATGSVSGAASGPITLTTSGGSASGTVTVGPNVGGTGTAFGTVSPYLALNFIIAINGLYPMRN